MGCILLVLYEEEQINAMSIAFIQKKKVCILYVVYDSSINLKKKQCDCSIIAEDLSFSLACTHTQPMCGPSIYTWTSAESCQLDR